MSSSRRPDAWFLAAAVISVVSVGVHLLGGGPEIMAPLFASDAPVITQAVLDVVWHQVTLLLAGSALALSVAAVRPAWRAPVAALVGLHYLAIAALFVLFGLRWFGGLWLMPQWTLFGAMAGLALTGFWRSRAAR